MKHAAVVALALSLCAVSTGIRADAGAPPNYLGAMGSYVITDSVRNTDNGVGWHVLYGSPIDERLALELNFFGHRSDLELVDGHDNAIGGGVDLRYLFGQRRLGVFVLGGLGSTWEDFVGDEEISPYFNVGAGVQIGGDSLQFRAEGRYYAILNGDTYADESAVYDARLNAGVMYSFGEEAPAPIADGDQDGVADDLDQCPQTPYGTAVDERGCPPSLIPRPDADTDGDGVVDTADQCPQTPAGTVVDAVGCPADEDGDGVLNADDNCPRTPPGFKVDAHGCVVEEQTVVVLDSVHFEFDSAKLTFEARDVLDRVATGLKNQPDLRIEIIGHTDALGTEAYNLQLSLARAASVREYLISRGAEPTQLTHEGYGETHPIADNETEEGRARNRRVEFHVLGQ